MKTKEVEVNGCSDCPFRNYSYDDFSLGDAESHHCNILQQAWREEFVINGKVGKMDYFIYFYKNGNVKSKNKKTLDSCPLLNNNIKVSLV